MSASDGDDYSSSGSEPEVAAATRAPPPLPAGHPSRLRAAANTAAFAHDIAANPRYRGEAVGPRARSAAAADVEGVSDGSDGDGSDSDSDGEDEEDGEDDDEYDDDDIAAPAARHSAPSAALTAELDAELAALEAQDGEAQLFAAKAGSADAATGAAVQMQLVRC